MYITKNPKQMHRDAGPPHCKRIKYKKIKSTTEMDVQIDGQTFYTANQGI